MISTASRFSVHGSFTDPSALRAPSPSPDVRLGSLTLMRHKMTFSHFSKGFIRPNLGEERGSGFQISAHPLTASPFFTTCKNKNQMLSVMARNSL